MKHRERWAIYFVWALIALWFVWMFVTNFE